MSPYIQTSIHAQDPGLIPSQESEWSGFTKCSPIDFVLREREEVEKVAKFSFRMRRTMYISVQAKVEREGKGVEGGMSAPQTAHHGREDGAMS